MQKSRAWLLHDANFDRDEASRPSAAISAPPLNRSELPFLAETTDQMAADIAEMREIGSRKQLLQAELAEATHGRRELQL